MRVLDGDLRMQIIQVAAPVAVDTAGIGNWLRDNAVKILLIVIGLVVLMASRRGDHSRVVSTVGSVADRADGAGDRVLGVGAGCRVLAGAVVHPEPADTGSGRVTRDADSDG